MKVQKSEPKKIEPTIQLKDATPGSVVRFDHDTAEDAIRCDLFWMRIDAPELKGRVRLVNITDGKQIERDEDRRVVKHEAALHVCL